MQVRKIFLFLLCSLFIFFSQQSNAALQDTQGKTIPLSQLTGKWIIVNYWAAWCDICVQEIPELNRFYKNNHDKNIYLLGVNYDDLPLTTLKETVRQMHIEFPVLTENPSQIWGLDGIEAIPVTFIISPAGKVVKKILGPNTEQSLHETLTLLQYIASPNPK